MANKIVLNTPKYKGEFDFDVEETPLSNLEWRWVKKISGYLPLTMQEGLRGADPDLFVAFAVIALKRSGKIQREDALRVADYFDELSFGESITFIADEEDDEELPPAEPAALKPTEPPSESTGGFSSPTSDPSGPPLSRIGALG